MLSAELLGQLAHSIRRMQAGRALGTKSGFAHCGSAGHSARRPNEQESAKSFAVDFHASATMRIFLGVTDKQWFDLHVSRGNVEEVNFWRPSPTATFKALGPGELLLFKLHAPDNFIVGGGFFTKFQQLPVNLAWDAFREANGAKSLEAMRARIAYYRRSPMASTENPTIGCILLAEPFFWPRDLWVPAPADFKLNTVQGKGYEAETPLCQHE